MILGSRKVVVDVVNLGRMGFLATKDLQSKVARQHRDEMDGKPEVKGQNLLLMAEHQPVYTTGSDSLQYGQSQEKKLRSLGAEFERPDRSGLITFHGPGQLVVYPILNLWDFTPSGRWYMNRLEKTMIRACKNFGLDAHTTENSRVWIGDKQIGSIGVHGNRYITTYGVSLNCHTDLSWFRHIDPYLSEGKEATSLSKETGKPVFIRHAIGAFLEAFEREFNCDLDISYLVTLQKEPEHLRPTYKLLRYWKV